MILRTEQDLKDLMYGLNCNGCNLYKNFHCTHSDALENERHKALCMDVSSKEWADNIDNYFLCDNYEDKLLLEANGKL